MTPPTPPTTEDDRAALVQQAVFYRDLAAEWQATAETYRADANVAKDRAEAQLKAELDALVEAVGRRDQGISDLRGMLATANARVAELDAANKRLGEFGLSATDQLNAASARAETAELDAKQGWDEVSRVQQVGLRAESEAAALRAELDLVTWHKESLRVEVERWQGLAHEECQRRSMAEASRDELRAIGGLGGGSGVGASERAQLALADERAAAERAELDALRAEVKRLREQNRAHVDQTDRLLRNSLTPAMAVDIASTRARLAAATALLSMVRDELENRGNLKRGTWAQLEQFVDSTPAPSERAAAERAVLEELERMPEHALQYWRDKGTVLQSNLAVLVLARRAVAAK